MRIWPQNDELQSRMGDLLSQWSHDLQAAAAYRHAIIIRPDQALSYSKLALCLASFGEIQQGFEPLDRFERLSNKTAPLYVSLAETQMAIGRTLKSCRSLKYAITLEPENALPYLHLYFVDQDNRHILLQRFTTLTAGCINPSISPSILNQWEDASGLKLSPFALLIIAPHLQHGYILLGGRMEILGIERQAIDLYERSFQIDPNNETPTLFLGSLLQRMGLSLIHI